MICTILYNRLFSVCLLQRICVQPLLGAHVWTDPLGIQGAKSMATHAAMMDIRQQKRSKVQSLARVREDDTASAGP